MPFIRVDQDAYNEIVGEFGPDDLPEGLGDRPSGGFEYESAEAAFEPEKLGAQARLVLGALTAMGATAFRVRYDGGNDEGFSHPDTVTVNGSRHDAAVVAGLLAKDAEFVRRLRAAAAGDSMYGNAEEMYRDVADGQVAAWALDELAESLASRLLGRGYGTGEYELYGAFTADLRAGEIADHEDAGPPPGGMD